MNKPLQPRTPSDLAKSAEQSKGNNSGGKQSTVKIERNSQKGETAQTSDKHLLELPEIALFHLPLLPSD